MSFVFALLLGFSRNCASYLLGCLKPERVLR